MALEPVGYAPWWTLETSGSYFQGAFRDQASMLKEVTFFGEFRFREDGAVVYTEGGNVALPIMIPDGSGGWQLNNDVNYQWYFSRIPAVVQAVKSASPDTRVTFTIGGWGNSQNFDVVGLDSEARANAVMQIRAIMDVVGFDGVDFDWEQGDGVSPNVNATAYANLVEATRAVLMPGEKLTVAIQPNLQHVGLAIQDSVDAIRVMTYDDPGAGGDPNHTSFIGAVTTIDSWMQAGVMAEKLAMGVAMYGRPLDNPWSSQAPYSDLDAWHFQGTGNWLPAWETEYNGFGFDSPDSILEKIEWSLGHGMAQIFAWDLSQDTQNLSHYLPLTTALSQAMPIPEPDGVGLGILGILTLFGLRLRLAVGRRLLRQACGADGA